MRIIAGEYRGQSIATGSGPGYRPATGRVREALFSMLEARDVYWPGISVLDVFAGSGVLGFEALSRGARSALFVEKNPRACALIRQNIARLGISRQRARVFRADALTFFNRKDLSHFGLVFVDPPYGQGMALQVIKGIMKANIVDSGGFVSMEAEAGLSFETQVHPELELVKDRSFGQTRICIWKKK